MLLKHDKGQPDVDKARQAKGIVNLWVVQGASFLVRWTSVPRTLDGSGIPFVACTRYMLFDTRPAASP